MLAQSVRSCRQELEKMAKTRSAREAEAAFKNRDVQGL